MAKIITLTVNPTIDKSTSVDTVASEIKLRCESPQFDPGGGGINVSRAIKKLGGESTAIYTSGGGTGQHLNSLLEREGITIKPILISGMTRENLTVYEESTGLQYRFGMPGPEITEWQACIEACFSQEADYLVASGSLAPKMPDDFYQQLVEHAKAKDAKTKIIVDTSGKALEACAKAGVFLLKPNLRELELLSGKQFTNEEHMITVAQDMIRDGMTEAFVISVGAQGAVFITEDKATKMYPPVVPIKSKVGAGDSMVGGIVWALGEGESLETAVRYGIAAGSAAVMTVGTELCRYDDAMSIFKQIVVVD